MYYLLYCCATLSGICTHYFVLAKSTTSLFFSADNELKLNK